jgi:hypothetical protein
LRLYGPCLHRDYPVLQRTGDFAGGRII